VAQLTRAQNTTILVVEDDPLQGRLLSHLLSRLGHRPILAGDCREARRVLNGSTVDLILLDINLPDLDGISFCRELRTRKSELELPIVILTADMKPQSIHAGLLAGANDYVVKGATEPELMARIEAHLRQSRWARECVAAEKQIALGSLFRGLCHEILNPLTVLTGYLEVLSTSTDQAIQREASDALTVSRCIERLVRLSQDPFAHDQVTFSPIDLPPLVNEATALARLGWRTHSFKLITEMPPDLPQVMGNRQSLCLLLLSIIGNAVPGLPGCDGEICVQAGTSSGQAWLAVRDNGNGVPEDQIEQLSDPLPGLLFADGGLNLGLPATKKIVEEHHGHLEVESLPGHGNRLTVYLPLAVSV